MKHWSAMDKYERAQFRSGWMAKQEAALQRKYGLPKSEAAMLALLDFDEYTRHQGMRAVRPNGKRKRAKKNMPLGTHAWDKHELALDQVSHRRYVITDVTWPAYDGAMQSQGIEAGDFPSARQRVREVASVILAKDSRNPNSIYISYMGARQLRAFNTYDGHGEWVGVAFEDLGGGLL